MSLIVFAFHYNRGASLDNLVASVGRHVDAPLVIMDDDSDLPDARAVLDRLSRRHEIVRPAGQRETESWTGGLHANMTRALDIAAARGAEMALMVQDDMQIVRDVTAQDLALAARAFDRPGASCVLHACFLKANRGERADDGTMEPVLPGIYERRMIDPVRQAGKFLSFSDTGIMSVPHYQAQLASFRTGERANEEVLAWQDKRMGFLVNPFMHWCPMPVSFRGRQRRWQDRLADRLSGAGLHPITPLEGAALERLLHRDPAILPYAEDFLTAPSLPPVRYWSLRGGRSNLQARGGWRRSLARFLT